MGRLFAPVWILFIIAPLCFAVDIDSLGEATICFRDTNTGVTHAIPSVKTDLVTIITDGFVHGRLTQTFINPLEDFLEATYIFPMPENSAVHGMCVVTGDEVLWGNIKEKSEAQAIYDSAKAEGRTTALLVQNRPNVFTQNIANIAPQETLQVIITYSSRIKYVMGNYEMSFPTTVGPRFNPPSGQTLQNPVYVPPGVRNGASLNIRILLITGYTPDQIISPTHEIDIYSAPVCIQELEELGITGNQYASMLANAKWIKLASRSELPNKDFVLRFDRLGTDLDYSFTFYKNPLKSDTGYFSLTIFPSLDDPANTTGLYSEPLELICVVDRSGSQNGPPLEMARKLSLALVNKLRPGDIFNIIDFAGSVSQCWPQPVPATPENVSTALSYLNAISAGGGTMLQYAVDASLKPPVDPSRQKIVAFMTDGYIGNDQDVLRSIQDNIGDIVLFSFGTGNSVNRYLIEEMGRIGNGVGRVVTLSEDANAVVDEFWAQVTAPQLKEIALDFGAVQVFDLIPNSYTRVFSGQPITRVGKYSGSALTNFRITGKRGEADYSQTIGINFPFLAPINRSLPKIWARKLVQQVELDPAMQDLVTELGLAYSIMTAYTSFVAVSDKITNTGKTWTSVEIAALWPDGVDPLTAGGTFVTGSVAPPPQDYSSGAPTGSHGFGGPTFDIEEADLAVIDLFEMNVFPNPFRPRANILLWLPASFNDVLEVNIYDINGKLIKRLFKGRTYQTKLALWWDGSNTENRYVSAGIYIIRAACENRVLYRRITFAK
jgi:Ca-activated chloride channel family protein